VVEIAERSRRPSPFLDSIITCGYNITDGSFTPEDSEMGIAERKQREKKRRRNAILKAAKRLISKHGVEGMSMNQLATATELNKATLYLYFSDKNVLIDTVVYEGLVLLESKYEEMDRTALSGLQNVLNLARITFAFYKEHPVYFYTMNHQERRRVSERLGTLIAEKGNEAASRVFERIAEEVRQGVEDGSIRKEIDINVFLVLFYAQIYGVMHFMYSKEDVYKDVLGLDPSIIEKSALETIEYYLKRGN
jgi:TetR/AcrR family transcriptional regulator